MFGSGFELVIFIPFVVVYGWLGIGVLATSLLWWDAGILRKGERWYSVRRLLALTLLCITVMPLPVWMVFKDKVLVKLYKEVRG